MYIVSGCLLGQNCKYSGGNNLCPEVADFCKQKQYITVCPESAGKLPTPRPPAERVGDRVINREGTDVTDRFLKGAELSMGTCRLLAEASGQELKGAILKANSPSCGCGQIYDGTFSGKLVLGNGIFTEMLLAEGIPVITEKDTETLKKWLAEE